MFFLCSPSVCLLPTSGTLKSPQLAGEGRPASEQGVRPRVPRERAQCPQGLGLVMRKDDMIRSVSGSCQSGPVKAGPRAAGPGWSGCRRMCRKYGQRAVVASTGMCEGDRQEVPASLAHTAHCTAWSIWTVFGLKGSPFIVIWGRSIGLVCEGSL